MAAEALAAAWLALAPTARPDCVEVAGVCIAPPYAAVAEGDYALRIGRPPPEPRIDEAQARRLGARIKMFSSDLVRTVEADAAHRRCVGLACVVVTDVEVTPTTAYVAWEALKPGETEARVYSSVTVTAETSAALRAGVAAVWLPTEPKGARVPLSIALKRPSE